MTFSLENSTIKGVVTRPPKILVYGIPGIGKSTFGSKFPNAYIMDFDGSLDKIDAAKTPQIKDLALAHEVLYQLITKEHNYKTLVIDTIDWLELCMYDKIARDNNKKDINEIRYHHGYTFLCKEWLEIFEALETLRLEKNMTIVLLSHAMVKTLNEPDGTSYDYFAPKLYGQKNKANSSLQILEEYCDIVMFANYKTYTKTIGDGKNKTKKAGVGHGNAVLYTKSHPGYCAKNRMNLSPEIDFTFETFAKEYAQKIQQINTEKK